MALSSLSHTSQPNPGWTALAEGALLLSIVWIVPVVVCRITAAIASRQVPQTGAYSSHTGPAHVTCFGFGVLVRGWMLTKAVAQGLKKGARSVVALGRPAGQAADVEHVASLRQRGIAGDKTEASARRSSAMSTDKTMSVRGIGADGTPRRHADQSGLSDLIPSTLSGSDRPPRTNPRTAPASWQHTELPGERSVPCGSISR